MKFITFALLVGIVCADNFAVLVAGSQGYGNYRHQADVAHSYQIVKRGGIPAENIITMVFDDIANHKSNPFPGKVFNHPGADPANVWAGLKIDYSGKAVSGENLLKVIKGDVTAPGPVVKSTSRDNIFLFYSDHGNKGLIALPGGTLYAKDLIPVLNQMHADRKYKNFVLYIEACYAGSMFLDLPDSIHVVGVTAAHDNESSWGWYCGADAVVAGKNIGSCLGDEFSVAWMEDTDRGMQTTETLEAQFKILVKKVTKSHVTRYGDVSFDQDTIDMYVGPGGPGPYDDEYPQSEVSWNAYDQTLNYLQYMWEISEGQAKDDYYKEYMEEVSIRHQIDRYVNSFATEDRFFSDELDYAHLDWDCYKRGVDQFQALFGNHEYGQKFYGVVGVMCAENGNFF